ncbi:MAG: hypothetical protein CM15mP125_0160 [Gammaproteobacteria bacterium]|nr:MAG: hypothetical protein CM15mP125_0160 [Gammaproteobacteria bacterium]
MWSFETDPNFRHHWTGLTNLPARKLNLSIWFSVSPVTLGTPTPQPLPPWRRYEKIVKQKQLWACHLEPELGGQGYGQVSLGLMNEILGRSRFGPSVFGCQAPDSGNAEILAKFGTPEQKEKYLKPLLNAEIASLLLHDRTPGGADPGEFRCTATRDGDDWVINGEKWFASHARFSAFLLVMVVTNPDVPIHEGASIFLVEQGTPGMEIIRNSAVGPYIEQGDGVHAYISFKDCRVPAENLLGDEGQGFHVAQTRLGGGRVHHAMRTVGVIRRAIDMMCERALSRRTKGELLADKQMTRKNCRRLHDDDAVPIACALHRVADRKSTRNTTGKSQRNRRHQSRDTQSVGRDCIPGDAPAWQPRQF